MMTWRPRSLQGRLLALVLALVLGLWAVTAAMVWRDARHELDELLDAHLAQAAALLAARQVHEFENEEEREEGERTEAAQELSGSESHRYAPQVAFQVFRKDRLLLRSAEAPREPLSQRREGFSTVTLGDGSRWRVFATAGEKRHVQLFVGEQLALRDDILSAVLEAALWPLLGALPLLALALWWAVRRSTQPLRELRLQLAERSPSALAPVQLAPDTPSEVQPLVETLNALFARIAALLEAERRFTADAAHELRTPIAAIRAQAQVALGEPDAGARRHALQATLAGCDRATRLVEQLLTLARLESDALPQTAPVDLAALSRRVAAELAPRALERRQELSLDAPDTPCVVSGNETLLAALLRNLLDNALRYSPAGSRVALTLQAAPQGGCTLRVADSGPGLSEAELQRLGERFFRALSATQDASQSGSGLGWSIAQRIAQVHGARLSAQRSATLGGLEVLVGFSEPVRKA